MQCSNFIWINSTKAIKSRFIIRNRGVEDQLNLSAKDLCRNYSRKFPLLKKDLKKYFYSLIFYGEKKKCRKKILTKLNQSRQISGLCLFHFRGLFRIPCYCFARTSSPLYICHGWKGFVSLVLIYGWMEATWSVSHPPLNTPPPLQRVSHKFTIHKQNNGKKLIKNIYIANILKIHATFFTCIVSWEVVNLNYLLNDSRNTRKSKKKEKHCKRIQ